MSDDQPVTDADLQLAERYASAPHAGDPGKLMRRLVAEVRTLRDGSEPATTRQLAAMEALVQAAIRWTDNKSDKAAPKAFARLMAELRRLRQLVIDAEPYVPDNEQTRTMDLPARLKAEVDRGGSGSV